MLLPIDQRYASPGIVESASALMFVRGGVEEVIRSGVIPIMKVRVVIQVSDRVMTLRPSAALNHSLQ